MGRFQTSGVYITEDANSKKHKTVLQNRHYVAYQLQDLFENICTPITRKFDIQLGSLRERHPQDKKRGMTVSVPTFKEVTNDNGGTEKVRHGTRYDISIKIRHPDNIEQFYNRGSLLAILFHELAHLKAMNHGEKFCSVQN